jgi:hypothetical protein
MGFFGADRPECAFCGSPDVRRWDHLVAVTQDGEAVLGNMVLACARSDDSQQHQPCEEWMTSDAKGSPKNRVITDIAGRVEQIKAYVQRFAYCVRPLGERLNGHELERLNRIHSRLDELRADTDSLIADYRARTGSQ